MKNYYFLIILLIVTNSLYGSPNTAPKRVNGLLRFIAHSANDLRDNRLYGLIAKRCNTYLPSGEKEICRRTVKRQIEILNYDLIFTASKKISNRNSWGPESFVFVAFKQSLISILSNPRTTTYLDRLKVGLNDFLTGKNPHFNIWEETLAFYNSPLIAAKTIAALFQDTSTVKLHLAFLERSGTRGRQSFDANRERLSRLIDTINLILDYNENNYRSLFYPNPIRKHLNRSLYHFYVPLYLSMALAHEKIPHKYALVAPMMMTLTYEFITMAPDYRYLLRDPARVDPIKHASTLRDIFACFSGASFGLKTNVAPGMYKMMRESFSRSTEDGVDFILQSTN